MRNVIPFVRPFDQGRAAAQALLDLVQAGAAMTADECFGLQLALGDHAPPEEYEEVYSATTCAMNEMVIHVARRKGVRPEWNVDQLLLTHAFDSFETRWLDLCARLAPGGAA